MKRDEFICGPDAVRIIGPLEGCEMSAFGVISALDKIQEHILQLPIKGVHEVVLETGTSDRNTVWHRHTIEIVDTLTIWKRFRVKADGGGDWVGEIVNHDAVQQGISAEHFVQSAMEDFVIN